jgi:D-alanyl-lipoteichoic acid acyltransferase DltB (MBOAT superfamily)
MLNPAMARTPADFWRRWNRPAQQFFHEYPFRAAGGAHRPIRGTLWAFVVSGLVHEYVFGIAAGAVQGWQMLFFGLHGLAAVATSRLRPRGWLVLPFVGSTIVFNIVLAVLFFKSVNSVLPFYSPRVH